MNLLSLLAFAGVATCNSQFNNLGRDYWSKWLENSETEHELTSLATGLEDAFNRAKMRIDINGASIFRPLMDYIQLTSD